MRIPWIPARLPFLQHRSAGCERHECLARFRLGLDSMVPLAGLDYAAHMELQLQHRRVHGRSLRIPFLQQSHNRSIADYEPTKEQYGRNHNERGNQQEY